MKLFEFLSRQQWAITPEALQGMVDLYVAARERKAAGLPLDIEAVEAQLGRPLDNSYAVTVRDGVAVIPIEGPIFRRADLFTDISGATTVETLARDFTQSLADPAIRSIVLAIDSPGGEINGINEFSNMVHAARSTKPVTAYVGHLGASAAYWIASAASEIVIDATAIVGSIGVIMPVTDPAKERTGKIEFISSQSPNKRPNPTTERGQAQIQALVDQTADVFIAAVARNRGITPEAVVADFGGGGVLVGEAAVKAGMADRLGSFEQVVGDLAAGRRAEPRQRAAQARTGVSRRAAHREDRMSDFWSTFWDKAFGNAPQGTLLEGHLAHTDGPPQAGEQIDGQGLPPARIASVAAHSGPSERERQLEAELAAARQQAATERDGRIQTEAEAFADRMVMESRAVPAEKDHLVALFKRAAEDDAASPANATRVALLKSALEARPPHGLTEEKIPGGELVALSNQTAMPDDARAMADQARAEASAWAERQNGPKPAA